MSLRGGRPERMLVDEGGVCCPAKSKDPDEAISRLSSTLNCLENGTLRGFAKYARNDISVPTLGVF